MVRMTTARDTTARRIAIAALAAAFGGYFYGAARADVTTEPDAAALAVRVKSLEAQVATLNERADDEDSITSTLLDASDQQATTIDNLASYPLQCISYSDFKYVRERVGIAGEGRHGRRWLLPVMVWNMADKTCRPNPNRIWKPMKHHASTRVLSAR